MGVTAASAWETRGGPMAPVRRGGSTRRSFVHGFALLAVWLTIASSAIVFTEPAPADVLMLGLIALLPVIGLVALRPALLQMFALWLLVAAGGLIASAQSPDVPHAATHTTVTLFLSLGALVIAAFVARRPHGHTQLILNALLWAASFAAAAGIVGYFDAVPGAFELFTRFGRATGTFKDPNVYGPFLVPALLTTIHLLWSAPPRRMLVPLATFCLLAFGLLLGFSRGAWVNAAMAIGVWGTLAFITARTNRKRLKLILLALVAAAGTLAMLATALQFDAVGRMFSERAALDQSYDLGPEGRFGGHEKAKRLILEHPPGIGAGVFTVVYHTEDVHNVFLSMFLNAGWLGGFSYAMLVVATLVIGLRHAVRAGAAQPLYLVAYAAFLAVALQGWTIDTDHWRHFFLLLGIVWGHVTAGGAEREMQRPAATVCAVRPAISTTPARRATSRSRRRRRGWSCPSSSCASCP